MQQNQPWMSKFIHSSETEANETILAFIRSQGYQDKPITELYSVIYYQAIENQSLRTDRLKLRNVVCQCKQVLSATLDKIK